MPFYVWSEKELGLGVHEMDDEHKELIARMNALYDGAEKKLPAPQLQNLIEQLASYTIKHFADEEAYMVKIGFAGVDTHKIIHQQLLKQFNEYVEQFKVSKTISPAFFNFLKVWLTSHIRGIDTKYSAHSKTLKKTGA